MRVAARRLYAGRVISLDLDTVRFPDGSTGELEIVRHPGASAVVPVSSHPGGPDPVILLLRQYRHAAGGTLWEVPAGRLAHPGEDPAACARRELREEAGVTAGRVVHLTTIWTTPGFTDETIHLFAATDLQAVAHEREADEFIEVQHRPLSQALAMIRSGEICDAKTALAILYWAAFASRRGVSPREDGPGNRGEL
jgi:ADP-ribose pyrophosphatase